MSFKDVGSGGAHAASAAHKPASPVVRAAAASDPALSQLTDSLRNYEVRLLRCCCCCCRCCDDGLVCAVREQQNVNLLRTQLSSSRRMAGNEGREMCVRPPLLASFSPLTACCCFVSVCFLFFPGVGRLMAQLRVLSDLEQRTHQQIQEQTRVLDSLPRADAAPKRVIVSKLSKDFDRLKQAHQSLVQQVAAMAQAQMEQMEREQHIENQLKVQMQAKAIEEEILREREQDILRINRDLRLINEMYKDLAAVVTQQQESVNEIAKSTEAAHAKAEEGLQQVTKAAELQTVCTIS